MPTTARTSTRTTTRTRSGARSQSKSAESDLRQVDALTLLKEDHRKVEELFSQLESARKSDRKQMLAQTICEELTLHAKLEESTFYPAVRETLKRKKDQEQLDEALVEHSTFKWLIARWQNETPDTDLFQALATVLKEYVQHHVKEEEKEMFPQVRKSSLDTRALGQTLQMAKQQLQKKLTH